MEIKHKCQITEAGKECQNKAKFTVLLELFTTYELCEEHALRAIKEGYITQEQILGEVEDEIN